MRHKKYCLLLGFCLFVLVNVIVSSEDFSLVLSSEKNMYTQEEEVVLVLEIKNISTKTLSVGIEYLQPIENQNIFIGGDFQLSIKSSEGPLISFTNYMPPEPRPGKRDVEIEPGEKVGWKIFFPYYYYPLKLPNQFKIQISYKNIVSNEIVVSIKETKGKTEKGIVLIPNFTQGEGSPFGWRLVDRKVVWDKEKGELVFNLDKQTAESEGVWLYSLFHKIETPTELGLDIKVKSGAPKVIVFVEGWGIVRDRRRRLERNELFVYPNKEMKNYRFTVLFNNSKVEWFRIKLFSYLKSGEVWFDFVDMFPAK